MGCFIKRNEASLSYYVLFLKSQLLEYAGSYVALCLACRYEVFVVIDVVGAMVFVFVTGGDGSCPVNGVGDDALNVGVVEGGAGLVTGLEIEDLARVAEVGHTCAEDVAVLIPRAEDELVRLGNEEGLGVKLLGFDEELVGNACGDGMGREQIPHNLSLVASPSEVTHCTDDGTEGLGVVRGVERDEAHLAHINAALDLGYESVVYLSVSHMSPPDENVGIVKHLVRKTLIGIVEGGKSYFDVIVLRKKFADSGVQTVRIDSLTGLIGLFVSEFIPDSYSDHGMYSLNYISILSPS